MTHFLRWPLPALLLLPLAAFAQALDGGVTLAAVPGVLGAATDGGLDPLKLLQVLFTFIVAGNGWGVGGVILCLAVWGIRVGGPKLHELLPDFKPLDIPLDFFFHTKAGGWALNLLTAVTGAMGTAYLVGSPVTWALVKPIIMVSTAGVTIVEFLKDLNEWWKARQAAKSATDAKVLEDKAKAIGVQVTATDKQVDATSNK